MEAADKMKRTLIGLKGHLTRQITKCQNLSQQSPVDYTELEDLLQVAENLGVKLPQINIPTFSGNENESWDDFWSKFVDAVDSKADIPQTTKFTYLQGLLRNEALKVISNITLTSDGYDLAVQLLKSNYDNKEKTITILVQKLLDLPCLEQSPLDVRDETEDDESNAPVHKLWDLDTLGIVPDQPSPDDTWMYQQYLDTVIFQDNQYWVRLPWKLNDPQLPVNYFMASTQLNSQLARLRKQPDKLQLYHALIQQQLANKFIEVVEEDNHKTGHYLPHHAVLKDSVTTPIRIVFNCSAKLKADSVSLNDCLQTGPSLTQRLQDVLLRFRSGVFAYTSDISKAFLRVGLQETDRDFTKFLWVKDPQDPNSKIITYRFASVLCGATSSPFLLQATLDTHLKKSNSPYKTEISNNLYIDNFQGTTNDENKQVEIYHEANRELLGANMPL
ncbi:uncharacterized protein [Procambarus clarkii]|uniref:uncharacterized protein n=1 Tax=Procambarus clarkii TaxID=6728 RepID=UPI0037439AEA